MALTKCAECSQEISDKADKCPSCGAPAEKKSEGMGMGASMLLGVLVMVGVFLLLGALTRNDETPNQGMTDVSDVERKLSAARGACLIVLNEQLHDPDSAKLERTSRWYTEQRLDGTVRVQPTGRAKNSFGAYINGTWDCIVRPEGENVRVIALKQIRP